MYANKLPERRQQNNIHYLSQTGEKICESTSNIILWQKPDGIGNIPTVMFTGETEFKLHNNCPLDRTYIGARFERIPFLLYIKKLSLVAHCKTKSSDPLLYILCYLKQQDKILRPSPLYPLLLEAFRNSNTGLPQQHIFYTLADRFVWIFFFFIEYSWNNTHVLNNT
jgi:hypothetical protein